MERVVPEPPRVSDIVAEAGSSKKAFYRYFAGKDDLLLAVLERGVGIIVSYLEHQMAKEDRPEDKIARWISGALAQIADPHLISMSRAVAGQMSLTHQRRSRRRHGPDARPADRTGQRARRTLTRSATPTRYSRSPPPPCAAMWARRLNPAVTTSTIWFGSACAALGASGKETP